MKPFSSMKRAGSHASHNNIASTLSFPQIDIESVKSKYRLKEKGQSNGAHGLPKSDSVDMDAVERDIIALIEQECDADLKRYLDDRRTYADRASALQLGQKIAEIDQIVLEAQSRIKACGRKGLDWLHSHQETLQADKKEFASFKREHRLDRPSRHPKRHDWHIALLIALLAIETGLNGKFLAVGDELGYLGGVVQALIIALVNIILGLFIGLAPARQWFHKSFFRKILGAASILGYLIWSFAFNLGVAHYRDELGGPDPESAASVAWITLRSSPLALHDINSVLLLVMGILFSIVSLADGLRWDDPYPGYGAVSRRHETAQAEYADEKADLIEEIEAVRDETGERLRILAGEVQANIEEYKQISEQRRALRRSFERHLDQLEAAANALIQFYRQENTLARPPEHPAPPRFERSWKLVRPSIIGDDEIAAPLMSTDAIVERLSHIPQLTKETIDTADAQILEYKLIAEHYGLENAEG